MIIGSAFAKGLMFLTWVLVGRILGAEKYGEFGIVRNTILMFSSFAGLGLGMSAVRYIAEYKETDKSKTSRIIGLSLSFGLLIGALVAIILYFSADWLSLNSLKNPKLSIDLKISALILFFASINGVQLAILEGLQSYKRIATIQLINSLFSIPIYICFAYYFGVLGSVIALGLSNLLLCFSSQKLIRRQLKENDITIDFKGFMSEYKMLLHFSIPAFLGGFIVSPVKWFADSTIFSQNKGAYSLGLFTAAFTLHTVFLLFIGMLNSPFTTIMSSNVNNPKDIRFQKFNLLGQWHIGILIILPFIAFPEIGELLFGKEYIGQEFRWTFLFVLLFTLLIFFKQGFVRLLVVHELQWQAFMWNITWVIVFLISFIYFRNFGSIGLAMNYSIAHIFSLFFILRILKKRNLLDYKQFFTKNTIIIWLIIFILFGLNYETINVFYRIPFLMIAYLFIIILIYKDFNLSINIIDLFNKKGQIIYQMKKTFNQ